MHQRMIMRMAVPWILGAVLIVFPFTAYPLGLGTLQVKSALNEPLYAEIDFMSITEEELKGLSVSLAPRADFDAVGAARLPFLSLIKFTIAQRPDGRYYVQLRTEEPLVEPFLHMLLQLEWVGGRLVREYTALIDPPSYVAGRPPVIESPETAPPLVRTSPFVETVPPPGRAAGELEPQVVPPPAPGRDALATRPADPPRQFAPPESPREVIMPSQVERPGRQPGTTAAERARAAPPARPLDWANFSEYRVRPGDTLWGIAERARADTGLSLHQVMLAIFRNNPEAFFRDNVNNLYAGKVLAIPERDQIESMSVAAARREFRAQYDVWQEYKLKLAASSRALKVADSAPAPAPSAAPPQAETEKSKTATGAAQQPEELLKIVRAAPSAEKKAAAGETPAGAESARPPEARERSALADRVTTLDESLASKQLEARELSEKLGQVRSQIKNEQRLIEIENQALAEQTGKPAAPPKPEAAKPEPAKPEPAKPETKAAAAPAPKPEAAAAKSETAPAKPKPAPAKPRQAAPRKPAPAAPPRPPEKGFLASLLDDFTSLLDDFLAGSLLPLLGGAVVLAGGGILMLYMRRRRRSIAEFEESILASDAIATTDAGLGTAETSGQATSGDTSFLSEFSKGGMGQVHTDEVDPIAEAEVYLAYGRDETAEEILKEAVAKSPERHELKHKLLEIYHQRNDVNAFETLAEELYAAIGGRGDDLWAKIEEMGRKLNPENPLFRGGTPERGAGAADRSAMAAVTDTRLQTASHIAAAGDGAYGGAAMPGGQAASATPSIDFNFDLDTPAAPAPAADNVLDFELNTADLPSPAPERADAGGNQSGADDDLASLQFDMPADNVIEFDGGNSGTGATVEPTQADTAPAGSDDDIKWEIDASLPAAPSAAAADAGDGSGNGGDAQWDETATKLDLAKAYIDMGDNEGARSILDEVLAEGNEQQKKQAAELAAQIA